MPEPNPNETEKDFISRCVPILIDEGKKGDQAIAVCYSIWENSQIKEHKSFKNLFLEAAQELPWIKNPKIGWWLDKDILTFYHGTHLKNKDFILKNGILAPKEGYTAGKVSLALEPNTALGYASMSGVGGETAFRDAGKKVSTTEINKRIVFILKVPKDYVLKNMIDKRANMKAQANKLEDRKLYDAHKGPDYKYYELTEIRLPKKVDPKFIKAYMVKK